MHGIVFDIQRFSLHDGPGIRTSVFLKGCPLQCLWCHNPESQSFEPEISFDDSRCRSSLACVDACDSPAHRVVDGRHVFDHRHAAACGPCVDACPTGALSWIGRRMSIEDVMAEVVRDRHFYDASGGGLTLSGGEPLAQPDFAIGLLRAARESGVSTCVDTSGEVAPRHLEKAAEYADLFLYDYKATGAELHRRLTGAGNERILANLELLDRLGAHVILRCPLVPGLNDSDAHLRAIAELEARYGCIERVDLMPYHGMGAEKARRIGREPALPETPDAGDADVARWNAAIDRFRTIVAH